MGKSYGVSMLAAILLALLMLMGAGKAWADDMVHVSSLDEFKVAIKSNSTIQLDEDIELAADTGINHDVVINLNGHILNCKDKSLVPYSSTVTICDDSSAGTGRITGRHLSQFKLDKQDILLLSFLNQGQSTVRALMASAL